MRNSIRVLLFRLVIVIVVINLLNPAHSFFLYEETDEAGVSLGTRAAFRDVLAEFEQYDVEEYDFELYGVPPFYEPEPFTARDFAFTLPVRRVEPVPLPAEVRGVYATGWTTGTAARFFNLLELVKETSLNSLVIDIKDDTGTVSYYSRIPAVQKLGAWENKIADPVEMLSILKERKIYSIARMVLFKDPVLAKKRPDLAVRHARGGIWLDNRGIGWVDPNSKEVWEYNVAIAKEAAAMGFSEIQFDYVRYPSDGILRNCVYPHTGEEAKAAVIEEFLRYARQQLEPLGVLVSVDLFGLVCSDPGHLGIGQNLERVAGTSDILSPMVYPSHYYPGTYDLDDPNRQPYDTVYRSLTDAQKRLTGKKAQLRPWLQDFSMGVNYGREEIMAQIGAARDAGVNDWLFWNPANRYNPAHYPADEEEIRIWEPPPPEEEETPVEPPAPEEEKIPVEPPLLPREKEYQSGRSGERRPAEETEDDKTEPGETTEAAELPEIWEETEQPGKEEKQPEKEEDQTGETEQVEEEIILEDVLPENGTAGY